MFNLSTPGPQYDLLENSNMASLIPLTPFQTPAVPLLREFRPFMPSIQDQTLPQLPFTHMPRHVPSTHHTPGTGPGISYTQASQ